MCETSCDGFSRTIPVSPNIDFFAAMLGGDGRLGHSVVYFETEMQFYYFEPLQNVYKPTSPQKLENYYRAMLIRCAQEVAETDKLNLFLDFRSDKTSKAVVNRAKSILDADSSFFGVESKYQRIKGPELVERVARVFVEELLTAEPGQILKLADAYGKFLEMLKERELPLIKRSDFKAVVVPLIRDEYNVCLRNDLPADGMSGIRGWKGVRLNQSVKS